MKAIKSIGIYAVGFFCFWIMAAVTIILLMLLVAAFSFLESILNSNRFGEGFIAFLFYGIALYVTCSIVGKLCNKATVATSKILTSIGITLIVLQVILAIINISNSVSIMWNIIGVLPGIVFILWRNEF